MKKLLISGSNGFLAQKLINQLSDNYKMVLLDKSKKKSRFINKKMFFKKIDLSKIKQLKTINQTKINTLIHAAAIQPFNNIGDFHSFYNGNITSTFNLVQTLGKNCKKIIFCSSFSVYQVDKNSENIKEENKLNPRNFYGLTKKICEEILIFFSKVYNYQLIILRFDGIFGNGQNLPGYINFCKNNLKKNKSIEIYNKGISKRDHVYVDDAIQAIIKSIKLKSKKNFILNIGGGNPTSQKKITEYMKKKLRSKSKITYSEKINKNFTKDVYLNIKKAKKILNFKPNNIFNNIDTFLIE